MEYEKRYNISPQLFYLWRTTGKLQTKELVKTIILYGLKMNQATT